MQAESAHWKNKAQACKPVPRKVEMIARVEQQHYRYCAARQAVIRPMMASSPAALMRLQYTADGEVGFGFDCSSKLLLVCNSSYNRWIYMGTCMHARVYPAAMILANQVGLRSNSACAVDARYR